MMSNKVSTAQPELNPSTQIITRVYKNHLKMVKGCRIDTGLCKKALSKKDPPKTLETRVSCKTGTGLGGQRARQT